MSVRWGEKEWNRTGLSGSQLWSRPLPLSQLFFWSSLNPLSAGAAQLSGECRSGEAHTDHLGADEPQFSHLKIGNSLPSYRKWPFSPGLNKKNQSKVLGGGTTDPAPV
jgi:hypothetical protein